MTDSGTWSRSVLAIAGLHRNDLLRRGLRQVAGSTGSSNMFVKHETQLGAPTERPSPYLTIGSLPESGQERLFGAIHLCTSTAKALPNRK